MYSIIWYKRYSASSAKCLFHIAIVVALMRLNMKRRQNETLHSRVNQCRNQTGNINNPLKHRLERWIWRCMGNIKSVMRDVVKNINWLNRDCQKVLAKSKKVQLLWPQGTKTEDRR